MDLIVDVDKLPVKGKTILGSTIKYVPGGKGANLAVAASRLGGDVTFLGKVGEDNFGKQLTSFLSSEKLNVGGLEKSSLPSGMAVITVDTNGNNTIVVLLGANREVSKAYIEKHEDLVKRADVICTQLEIPLESAETLIGLAKKHNKTTIFNLAPVLSVSTETLRNVDYLVVNESELSTLVKSSKTIDEENEIVKAVKSIKSQTVIVTLGEKGAIAVSKDKILKVPGIKVKAVDTTAAGDCFVGAFATQIDKGVELQEALDFANRASALSVQKWGASASLPSISELQS